MDIAPTNRSAIAMLDNSTVDALFNSVFCCKAKTTIAFNKMTATEATDVMGNRIKGIIVSLKSHLKFDVCEQWITDLVFTKRVVFGSELVTAMSMQDSERSAATIHKQGSFRL